jgi:hypothetical protein
VPCSRSVVTLGEAVPVLHDALTRRRQGTRLRADSPRVSAALNARASNPGRHSVPTVRSKAFVLVRTMPVAGSSMPDDLQAQLQSGEARYGRHGPDARRRAAARQQQVRDDRRDQTHTSVSHRVAAAPAPANRALGTASELGTMISRSP